MPRLVARQATDPVRLPRREGVMDQSWFPELEHFLGIGEGKLIWRLSVKNVGGLLGGAFLSHRLATSVGVDGLPVLLLTLVGTVLGVWLTTQHHGMTRILRVLLMLRFVAVGLVGGRTLDAVQLYTVADDTTPRIRVKARQGGTVLTLGRGTRVLPSDALAVVPPLAAGAINNGSRGGDEAHEL
jgi:hypothetical protein